MLILWLIPRPIFFPSRGSASEDFRRFANPAITCAKICPRSPDFDDDGNFKPSSEEAKYDNYFISALWPRSERYCNKLISQIGFRELAQVVDRSGQARRCYKVQIFVMTADETQTTPGRRWTWTWPLGSGPDGHLKAERNSLTWNNKPKLRVPTWVV